MLPARRGAGELSSDPLRALAGACPEAWLVGGALRDRLLGRPTADYDAVLPAGAVRDVARRVARSAGAIAFELSESFGAWRVVARDRVWQLDLMALEGERIEDDLARRDLTVNALAERLGSGELVDPFNAVGDLRARRLRMVSAGAFAADPVRILRLARLGCELGFAPEPDTVGCAAASSGALAAAPAERVFAELKRIVCADAALEGLEILERTGATEVLLPEVAALRGVEQSRFHHLDVYEHTCAVLSETINLERDPEPLLGARALAVREWLARPLADELNRGQALRFGALLHDIAKPRTRESTASGRVTFLGHDEAGAELSLAILGRLRASERLAVHVAALTRHHLRLGFLVNEMPLERRTVYRYLRECGEVAPDVTLLSIADRLATRGEAVAEGAIGRHLDLARHLLDEALRWAAAPPRAPVRGDVLADALGLEAGPMIGDLLGRLEEAAFAGEVGSRAEAIEYARRLLTEASLAGAEPRPPRATQRR